MSEKGQKIFKWILWLTILLGVVLWIALRVHAIANPHITKSEWVDMLGEKIDKNYTYGRGITELTGRDIAVVSMKTLGNRRLSHMTEEDYTDEEVLVSLAIKNGIVKKTELDKGFSEKEAEKKLDQLMHLYSDPETYPVYEESVYADNVIDTSSWTIEAVNEDTTEMHVAGAIEEPVVGNIILFRNEYGLANARTITDCEGDANQGYRLTLGDVNTITDVVTQLSFSGCGDFSYLEKMAASSLDDTKDHMSQNMLNAKEDYLNLGAMTVYAASAHGGTNKTDLELEVKYEKEADDVNPKDNLSVTVKVGNEKLEFSGEEEKKSKPDQIKYSSEGKKGVSGTIKIKNLSVVCDGEWNLLNNQDESNEISVVVNSDIELDLAVEGKLEGEIEFPYIPIPIGGGIISVDLQPILKIEASGEVSLVWKMNNIRKGIMYSTKDKITWIDQNDGLTADFKAKVEVKGGINLQAKLVLLESSDYLKTTLADPGIEILAVLHAETLPKNPGYELYDPCVDVKFYAPTIEIFASGSVNLPEDKQSILAKVLNALQIKASEELMNEDNAIYKKTTHVEREQDGTIHVEAECTHIEQVAEEETTASLSDKIDSTINQKAEETMDKLQVELEQRLNQWLDKWVMKRCEEC